MIIYKANGDVRATIEVAEDAELLLQVSDECSFTTKVELSTFVAFAVGDYVEVFGERYHIAKKPTPTKHGTNKYEWTLKFVDARDYLSNVSLYLSDGTSLLPYDADTIYCYDAVCSVAYQVWRYVYPTADKNHTPTEDDYWDRVSAYNVATPYAVGATVYRSNVVYRCIKANTGASLTNDTYWSVMNTAPMWDFATVLSPSDYAQLICDCMNRETTQHWVVGSCISSTPKEQSFSNVQCLDAAASVAELFETEMFVDMSGTDYRLNFNRLAYIATPQLKLAQGNGLFNISVQENTSAKKVTRLVALGGTKNLNGTYRNGSKRLMLPNAYYLDSVNRDAADPHNATVTWDEIYPALTHATDDFSELVAYQIGDQVLYGGLSYDCTTTHTAGAWNAAHFTVSEGQVTSVETTAPTAATTKFKFIDEQLTFNPRDPKYIMADGTLPKVHFVTGNMAGYEFPVLEFDSVTKQITIQQIQDSTDSVLPTVGYMFDVNDRYYFTDIYMPQSYVAKAELRLKARALDYLSKYEKDQITYSCTVDLGANLDLHKGEIVTLVDATFGLDADYRIVSLRRKVRKPYKYDITLSDHPYIPTRITKIENSIKQNETYIERNNLQSVMAKARTFQGAQEAINKAFDPSGDYFTNVIKPLIIETSAVLVGTNEQQYTLTGLEFTAITTNPNYLSWTAGSITDSRVEDTPRTWTIAAGNFTATSDTTAYYCYIRCERALGSTVAEIIFDADQHLTKEDTTYYYFLLGTLTSLNDGFRQLWTSKGYTFINGDSIVTGKIQNTQGSVVIDLANETIHFGNIANTAYFDFDASTGVMEFKGIIRQSSLVVDDGGNTSNITVDRGTWSDSAQYYVGNTVQYNGSTYYCKVQPTIGIVPTNIVYWNVIAIAGAAGADARVVSLTAAALGVVYDTAGANPSPAYILVIAKALNTSGTVYYEFFKNDVSIRNTTTSSYSYSPRAAYADMPDKIEVQIRENSSTGAVLARDQITIVGQKAGSDAITAILSNEAHTFAASNSGVVSIYTGSGTTIRVYEGTTELVYDGVGTANGTWKVTAVSSGITRGLFTDSGTYCTVGDASDFADAAPIGYVQYTISGKNSAGVAFSLVKRQSFSKSYMGAIGATLYTWIKYADTSIGGGLSDDPTGKEYIGLAYNKTTPTESTTASDYSWSLIKGDTGNTGATGATGADGVTTYTWIKYADVADGTGLYDTPNSSTQYIGIAVNKTTPTESTTKTDYTWSKFKGDQGVAGADGLAGADGADGADTIYIYCENQNLSVSPSGSAFTKAIVIRLLSGGTPIPVASWTSKTKTLTGLTAAADGSSGNDWTINLAAFTTDTVAVGYVNVSIVYAGVTYALSISVARIFNAVMINGKTWVSGATYIGSCLQRSVVKYGATWYALKTSVGTISSSVPPSESNDWEALNSFSNVATDSLFAEGANIANFLFNNQRMESQAKTNNIPNIILDGINGTGKIGRYRTDADGFKSGTPENWTNSADESDYVQLSPGVVRMQQSDSYAGSAISRSKVGFGEGADPDSIENFTAGYIYRRGSAVVSSKMYKPALKLISDNAHNRDVAMYIEGAVPIFGGMLPSAYFMDAGSVTVLDFSFGNNVIVKNTAYRSVYLPTRVLMGYVMNTTGSFAVEVKIIGAYNNTQNFLLSFQTGESTLYFRNTNGGLRGETIAIGAGDVVTIMLIYDGTNYYAQTMYVSA